MTDTKTHREFWLFKNGTGCADPDYQSAKPDVTLIDDFIHVVEHSALLAEQEKTKELVNGLENILFQLADEGFLTAINICDELIEKYGAPNE